MKKREGMAYLVVIITIIFVSSMTAIMITSINNAINNAQIRSMQMNAYYFTQTAADATVYAVARDKELFEKHMEKIKSRGTQTDKIVHNYDGQRQAVSYITLKREKHSYYGDDRYWMVIDIKTIIHDKRFNKSNDKVTTGIFDNEFNYEGTIMILEEDPNIQVYYLDPDQSALIN